MAAAVGCNEPHPVGTVAAPPETATTTAPSATTTPSATTAEAGTQPAPDDVSPRVGTTANVPDRKK